MTQKEIDALKPQKGEGIADKPTMGTWRVDPEENRRLQTQAKTNSPITYKRGSSSGDSSSKSKSKSKNKESVMIGGKKPSLTQRKLMASGWTAAELEAKKKAHKKSQADRKAGKKKAKRYDPRAGRR